MAAPPATRWGSSAEFSQTAYTGGSWTKARRRGCGRILCTRAVGLQATGTTSEVSTVHALWPAGACRRRGRRQHQHREKGRRQRWGDEAARPAEAEKGWKRWLTHHDSGDRWQASQCCTGAWAAECRGAPPATCDEGVRTDKGNRTGEKKKRNGERKQKKLMVRFMAGKR